MCVYAFMYTHTSVPAPGVTKYQRANTIRTAPLIQESQYDYYSAG